MLFYASVCSLFFRRLELYAALYNKGADSQDTAQWTLGTYVKHLQDASPARESDFTIKKKCAVMRGSCFAKACEGSSTYSKSNDSWGWANVLGVPWSKVLEDEQAFFPDGCLVLKMDVWFEDKGPRDDESDDEPYDESGDESDV